MLHEEVDLYYDKSMLVLGSIHGIKSQDRHCLFRVHGPLRC